MNLTSASLTRQKPAATSRVIIIRKRFGKKRIVVCVMSNLTSVTFISLLWLEDARWESGIFNTLLSE